MSARPSPRRPTAGPLTTLRRWKRWPAGPFSSLVVLGDSLSDCGNAGRFCEGPSVDLLAEQLALPLTPASQGGTN